MIKTEPCGYGCGKPWRRWEGTKLIGHAKCAATEIILADVAKLLKDPHTTQAQIAAKYSVTTSVVRAWAALVKERGR